MSALPAAVQEYLGTLTNRLRSALGEDLIAVTLTGSAALDAFDQRTSDLDVAAVCADDVDVERRRSLSARLQHRALPCPVRGLEFVLYPESTAQGGGGEPGFLLEVNDGPGMPFRLALDPSERVGGGGAFWYVIDRSILRACGRSLWGPPPSDVYVEPDRELVSGAVASSVRWHLGASVGKSTLTNCTSATPSSTPAGDFAGR